MGDEIQIYTWADASLKELTGLIQQVREDAKNPQATMHYAIIYPDVKGKFTIRDVGKTFARRKSEDDHKSLQNVQFHTGDFLSVKIETAP
eukprot:NODE_3796_length_378_cov_540.729483_g3225_i0.p1 GENE.NODE_3796_length_378_cov_540.729483_g3225_i0~~NODE_3796_length_378_cov_540.729483_g3225_i0.p1  ORF type:complete len:99 (+),score=32.28 NODE_3796_length_378_cov_540.729483_g3225_i0:30-299(+)